LCVNAKASKTYAVLGSGYGGPQEADVVCLHPPKKLNLEKSMGMSFLHHALNKTSR